MSPFPCRAEEGREMPKALGGILVAVMLGALAVPAAAQPPSVCRFTAELAVSPGLSTAATSGESTSGGETGSIDCDGWVAGRQPTGPGTFGVTGRYGTRSPDTCASGGEGDGLQSFTIPTAQGPLHLESRFTFLYHGTQSGGRGLTGNFEGKSFSGTFELIPLDGECGTSPVTRIVFRGEGKVRGWNPSGGERCGGSAVSA
jgi:hypothetical protein